MIDQEQKLVLTWLVLPAEDGSNLQKLLVSAPDGQIVEFFLSSQAAEKLPDMLNSSALWQTFFSSLINSMEMSNV
jgi:hypothetical protein